MHEYPLTQRVIEIAKQHASKNGAVRVSKISLVVGEYSGVIADCMLLYFDIISEGTVCEGAVLDVESVKPLLKCKKCGMLYPRKPFSFSCEDESCGGEGEPTDIGREFYVKSIEVEY